LCEHEGVDERSVNPWPYYERQPSCAAIKFLWLIEWELFPTGAA